mmetsp:Transcript_31090/g.69043  ORF Transcript_31090/g.69043 Transcript_31090/m.69043 type:complete len:287 (+) Transcript_31090:144-1004(+)|eukprot:CAMPEP_0202897178 /NCGR_PEP_ID=MMETSP1392-20130828/6011_1 /ASSEMBLY_ACC=CAM_ASM_000868 /TAXON_ID=225041 /ORGANISM="Chlamydomonas chlamydogama, Strain SAG 11-48b" /LENGTH=286 /DNA_ID=CAMNT_0049582755 /DNA_START=140 /DNA_END=1000 /DNA_ORIENTATION=+
MASLQGRGNPRSRVIDIVPDGAAQDPDFVRVQRDLEEQQRQGWMFGRGALDRQDVAYLKEFKEELRNREEELEEMSSLEYARLRSQAEAEVEAGVSGRFAAAPGALLIATKQKKEMRPPSKLLPIVKVAPASKTSPAGVPGAVHVAKRPRLEGQSSGEVPAPSHAASNNHAKPVPNATASLAKAPSTKSEDNSELVGLLGYSDSDGEDASEDAPGKTGEAKVGEEAGKKGAHPSEGSKPSLPSAAELLEGPGKEDGAAGNSTDGREGTINSTGAVWGDSSSDGQES